MKNAPRNAALLLLSLALAACGQQGSPAASGAGSQAAAALTRPRPLAFAGNAISWQVDGDRFTAVWDGLDCEEPSEFWFPNVPQTALAVECDGVGTPVLRDSDRVFVEPGRGRFSLTATWR